MKYLLLISFSILLLSGCMLSAGSQYGDNFKQDKYQRNGFNCIGSTIEVKNKTDQNQTFIVDSEKHFIQSGEKTEIYLSPGYHHIEDGIFDEMKLDVIPCHHYKFTYK